MIRAVIFDLDGTMVDTETMWVDVNVQLAKQYGKRFDPAVRVQMMGRRDPEALTAFKEHHAIDASVEGLIAARRKLVKEDVTLVKTAHGLFELLGLLDRLKLKKAVATSASRQFALNILDRFDLTKRFDAMVTAEDVTHSKPHPEPYLEAARRVGVRPADCLVLEDAEIGVASAYAAGMKICAIPHDASREHDFSKATKILSSMSEVDEDLLRSL